MPTIAVIGDGQLARMMHTEAIELGQSLTVLASSHDSSAAHVTANVMIGDYTDIADLRAIGATADVVTFDHEHVPTDHLHTLICEGINVHPRPEALVYAQDKLQMRTRLAELGAPLPQFRGIASVAEAEEFYEQVDGEVCIKARRGGYDGHGVWFPQSRNELSALVAQLIDAGTPVMAEQKMQLRRELSALLARTPSGEVAVWPVVESVQRDGICVEAVAPAPDLAPELAHYAQDLARRIADELGVTGVLAVELFEVPASDGTDTTIVVNELAMRPHNTGHWTQDGAITSQFEQHLRAVVDWPLGATEAIAPVTVMANVLGAPTNPAMPITERMATVWNRYPQAKIHFYGKTYRAGRKLGHVNLSGTDVTETRVAARAAAFFLAHGYWDE